MTVSTKQYGKTIQNQNVEIACHKTSIDEAAKEKDAKITKLGNEIQNKCDESAKFTPYLALEKRLQMKDGDF